MDTPECSDVSLAASMTSHATTSSLSTPLRLDALRSAGLLDSSAEESFDRLTRLAAHVLATPIALD